MTPATGFVAQAAGAGDEPEVRATLLGLALCATVILLQIPLGWAFFTLVNGSAAVEAVATDHDAAFDQGFLSVANEGTILLSPLLDPQSRHILGLHEALHLRLPPSPAHHPYFSWHRTHLFRQGPPSSS